MIYIFEGKSYSNITTIFNQEEVLKKQIGETQEYFVLFQMKYIKEILYLVKHLINLFIMRM